MKINIKRLSFKKKPCLLVCFFACMFVFASFNKEDRWKVREFKKTLVSKLMNKKDSLSEPLQEAETRVSAHKEPSLGDSKPALQEEAVPTYQDLGEGNHFNHFVLNNNEEKIENIYSSNEKQGVIGTFSDKEDDRISDNFFTIDIPNITQGNTTAYLEYDLLGLSSHASVSRSINKSIAIGGDIIIPNSGWSIQKEEITINSLKKGKNTILFTSPEIGIKYKVKNVRLVLEKDQNNSSDVSVSMVLSGNNLYVKGTEKSQVHQITVNDQLVPVVDGSFEKMLIVSDKDKKTGEISIASARGVMHYKIPSSVKSYKTLNSNFAAPQLTTILKDRDYKINYEDAVVAIDKESVENSALVQLFRLRKKDIPSTSQGIKNVTLHSGGYRVNIADGVLNKKMKITIPYDEKSLGLVSPKEIKAFYFDYTEKQWKIESSSVVDEKTKTVTIESTGDNDYINGVISVPESPQTNAFAPTSISGLKAGDPAAGIQLMSPPSANQRGDASMSYPIEIPSGRKGMQPNLSIAYNSSKGNGWMGEGWDVSGISGITLDTRWGTPTFDSGTESEIYLLDGEMLIYAGDYLPHRHNSASPSGTFDTTKQARNSSGTREFYIRKNNNFLKIVRYGETPSNYRWVITTTDGTKRYYGGDESSVNTNAAVTTENGNIVQWGITKELDVYNNNIKYYYDNKVFAAGQYPAVGENENLAGGHDFHIRTIAYTGENDIDGPYTVRFVYKNMERQDLSISAKEGVKRVEVHKLESVSVSHKDYIGTPVKTYAFEYKTGAFYKTLLSKISTDGVNYQLDYHNDADVLFAKDVNIYAPDTDAFSGAVNSVLTPSKISADSNFEWGWALRIGAGLGLLLPHTTGDKNFMVSGFTGGSYPTNKRTQELIDFNGDGVVDVLYRKRNGDNGIKFYPGSLDGNGNLQFNFQQKNVLNLNSNFTKTTGNTFNGGGTILFNWWKMGFDFTKSWSESDSTTPVYLTDANSDGLPDVVKEGKVWFNKINSNGQTEMVTTSESTENMVITGNTPVPYTEPEDPADEYEEPVKAKNDVVKVWIAPKSGYIKISDNISISGTVDPAAKAVYSIEAKNANSLPKNGRLFLTTLTGGAASQSVQIEHYNDYANTPLGINSSSRVFVNSGDKIYFRLHKKKGVNYVVSTKPMVQYLEANGSLITDSVEEEQDDFMPNNLKYEENFLLNNLIKSVKFDYPGFAKIKIPQFTVPKLNDEVTYSIILSKVNIVDPATDIVVVYKQTYPASDTPTIIWPVAKNITIQPNEQWNLKFFVQSDSYMDKSLEWKNIEINSYGNIITNEVAQSPSYYVKNFSKKFSLSTVSNVPQGTNDYYISLNKNFGFTPTLSGNFTYVIKKNGHVLGKRAVSISGGNVMESMFDGTPVSGTDPIPFYSGDPLQGIAVEDKINILVYCNSYADRLAYEGFKAQLQNNIFNIYYGAGHELLTSTVETSLSTGEFNGISAVYHNWGQFIYNENKDIKKGNNSLNPPNDPKEIESQTGPIQTSGPDYTLNPDTPKDQYGMLINNDFMDAPFGQLNYNYSACSGSTSSSQYADCVGDILQANFQNAANNIMASFSPIVPMSTYYKKDDSGHFTEKWVNNIFTEQYSMPSSFRDEENISPFFVDDDPDEQDVEVQGNINTQMYAIDKKQKSKAKTTNWGIGIPVISHSVSQLRGYGNINTQDFFDVNGDGYPDMLYRTELQLTNPLGGLKNASGRNIENNGDSVISNNDSFQKANTIAFSPQAIKTVGRMISNTSSDAKTDTSSPWSGGLSFTGYPDSYDKGLKYWIDVNGDGLVDRVETNGNEFKYKLNYGKGLVNNPYEKFVGLNTNISAPVGGTGVSIGGALGGMLDTAATISAGWGISGSLSASSSTGSSKQTFQDVNGDGLVDIVNVAGGTAMVSYNMGNKFGSPQALLKQGSGLLPLQTDLSNEVKTYNGALTLGGGVYVNVPLITIFGVTILYFRAGADVTANIGNSVSEINKALKDVNGDGYPDLIVNTGDGFTVNYSKVGRTNKLAKVTEKNTNGTFSIDYGFSTPSYNNPNSKLVMNKVEVFNPNAESDTYSFSTSGKNIVTKYGYENSKYDRREREQYGFEKVTSEDINAGTVERRTVQTFYNSTYFNNGLPRKTEVFISGGTVLSSKSENTYNQYKFINNNTQIEEIPASQFESYDSGGTEGRRKATIFATGSTNTVYENGNSITTGSKMIYNNKGQLINFNHVSNLPLGNYSSAIAYHSNAILTAKNILNIPSEIKVFDSNNNLIRQRNTKVNSANGSITSVLVKLNDTQIAETRIKYGAYGNIAIVGYPEGYSLSYEYDSMGKYVTKVTDSFGVSSTSTYDPRWDAVLQSVDVTGNTMKYTYDSMGRLTSILAPKEVGVSPYTVKYTYFLSPITMNNITFNLYGAITQNFDPAHAANPIETITLSDFTGKEVQVKKDIEMDGAEKMSVSGMVMNDALGRPVKQYHPTYEDKNTVLNKKLKLTLPQYFTMNQYDALDRIITTTDEDGNVTTTKYDIEGDNMKKTVSQMQNSSAELKSDILSNAEGKTVITRNYLGGQALTTTYEYNSVGELLGTKDPEGIKTAYTYDMGGRRTAEIHPDHGVTRYEYDQEGRVKSRMTANLENSGLPDPFIRYKYDGNRLVSIDYPNLPNGSQNPNNVSYGYGTTGNETGRLVYKSDGTGNTTYTYGNMGELIKEMRHVTGYNIPNMNFSTFYDYDSWNRLKSIKYPDTERVNYSYDLGGNLKTIKSDQYGEYVKEIKYDEYEQRTKIWFGNNTYSSFTYSPSKRMMNTHALKKDNYADFLSNTYAYDNVGNVLSIKNSSYITPNMMGGTYDLAYSYDEMNRLVSSVGSIDGNIKDPNMGTLSASYETYLEYNKVSGINVKRQNHTVNNSINPLNTYNNMYKYIDGTHKVKGVNDQLTGTQETFEYDFNGNLINHDNGVDGVKSMFWDEEDNMRAYSAPDQGTYQYYAYDDKGERTIKYNLDGGAVLYQNGVPIDPGSMTMTAYKVYPNPYIVVTSDNKYTKHYYAGSQRIASRLGDNPGLFNKTSSSPKTDVGKETVNPETDFKAYLEKAGLETGKIETEFGKNSSQTGLYYLHGDHLGTATYVTDDTGVATQFFLNLPFGETFVEQQIQGKYENPYKFNAKELDSETGFYYYGARYYNPRLSIWYGVDPIAIHNPVMESEFYGDGQHNGGVYNQGNLNPYIYTYQNPVKYIDPNGKQIVSPFLAPPPPLVPGAIHSNKKGGAIYYRPGIPFPIFDTSSLVEGFNRQVGTNTAIILGVTAVASEGFKEIFNRVDSGLSILFSDKLDPENDYVGAKTHGIYWHENDAKKRAHDTKNPQGKWGSKEDLDYAGRMAATLPAGPLNKKGKPTKGNLVDFPINEGSTSTVYNPDGTQSRPDMIRIRNNGNGKFHGFPINSKTAGPIYNK